MSSVFLLSLLVRRVGSKDPLDRNVNVSIIAHSGKEVINEQVLDHNV